MEYPEAVWVPLIPQGTMFEDTASGLQSITRTALNTDSAIPIDRIPQTLTNIDKMAYQRSADDTDFDATFQWIPEASGKIDKFFINIATLMHITAWTSNGVTFNSVTITITRTGGNDELYREVFPTGLAQAGDDEDADLFIVSQPVWGADLRIRAGNPINIRVQTANTKVATNTFHSGLCPIFPQQIPATAADPQFWSHSGILFFITRDRKN